MLLIIGLLCLFPVLALAVQGRSGLGWAEGARVGLLFGLSLGVASPFLTNRGIGAGDALNYAEAVADGVIQIRAGVLPVYVGQSEYAFNGRVHPLRTAGYFTYATGLLDVLVRHRLSFWGLQNLLLAASLTGAGFSAYFCLRKLATVGPWTALALAGIYLLSPGLLAPAYGMDLYMTVTTAPYLPIVLLALTRCLADRGFGAMSLLAIGLAACWLMHSPVAVWLTLGCLLALLVGLAAQRPRWRDLLVLPAAALLGAALCGYGFAASMTIDPQLTPTTYARTAPGFVNSVTSMTKMAFPDSLRPVSQHGNTLGDFQLGYAEWILLGCGLWLTLRRRAGMAGAIGTMILFYAIVTMPVPWLNRKLWEILPNSVSGMTNLWPMQRIYTLLSVTIVFFAALVWPRFERLGLHVAAVVLVMAGLGWSGWEAWHFIRHGLATAVSPERNAALQHPENVDLTINSYAFLSFPSWFSPGPMDPEHGLRLRSNNDMGVLASNWTAGRIFPPVAAGRLRIGRAEGDAHHLEPRLTLESGKRYRLRFQFLTKRMDALLHLRGETMWRDQVLPSYAGAAGFGMDPGNNPELVLYTTSPRTEHVELILDNLTGTKWEWTDFAEFTLEEIDRAALPFQLVSLVPQLVVRIDAAQAGWLETPRMYIQGYEARVDGKPAAVVQSPESLAAVAVPEGRHTVEMSYPGSPLLRRTFYLALWSWVAVVGWFVVRALWRTIGGGRAPAANPEPAG